MTPGNMQAVMETLDTASNVPLVSVVMPVHNAEQHLREAIDSILMQTFANLELLVIDDGSTDSSLKIAQSYIDNRVHVIDGPHQGIVAALNRGLVEARGDYVARMDADDIATPQRLMRQLAYMESHSDAAIVGSWADVIDADGKYTGQRLMPPTQGKQLYLALCAKNVMIHGSIMTRRDAVLAVGGYRMGIAPAEDYDLWLRLAALGAVANIAEPLYKWRSHDSSVLGSSGSWVAERRVNSARKSALQRRLAGSECVNSGLSTVTLAGWAHVLLGQGQLLLGSYVLIRALLSQPHDTHAKSVIRQYFGGISIVRTISRGFRRAASLFLLWAKALR